MRLLEIALFTLIQLSCPARSNQNLLPLATGCDSNAVELALSGAALDHLRIYEGIYYRDGEYAGKPLWKLANGLAAIYFAEHCHIGEDCTGEADPDWQVTAAKTAGDLQTRIDAGGYYSMKYDIKTEMWGYASLERECVTKGTGATRSGSDCGANNDQDCTVEENCTASVTSPAGWYSKWADAADGLITVKCKEPTEPLPLDTDCASDTVKMSLSGAARDAWPILAGIYHHVGEHNGKPLWLGGALHQHGAIGAIYFTTNNGWMATLAKSMEGLQQELDGSGGIHYNINTETWSYVDHPGVAGDGEWADAPDLIALKCVELTAEQLLAKKLSDAIENTGDLATVEQLLTQGAQPDGYKGGLFQMTALIEASHRGLADVARALVAAGANVNARDGLGLTPLMHASQYGHLDVVRVLVGKADVNATAEGVTALMLAAQEGYMDIVRVLVEDGKANVMLNDALEVAKAMNHADVLAYLEKVTPTNSPGPSPQSPGPGRYSRIDGRSNSMSIRPPTILALLVILFTF